jgi:uncharacterized delta-60 repeat protein
MFLLIFNIFNDLNEGPSQNYNEFTNRDLLRESSTFVWNMTWGTVDADQAYSIAVNNLTNELYVTGFTDNTSDGAHDLILLKYNNNGNLIWNRTWGSAEHDIGYDLALDSLGNIYICGQTYIGSTYDSLLLKYNSSGDLQWVETWGGTGGDRGSEIVITPNDDIFIAGHTSSYGVGNFDICLLKYNTSGFLHWNITWGYTDSDEGYGITVDSNENIYITGITDNPSTLLDEAVLIKFSSSGTEIWNRTWNNHGIAGWHWGWDVAADSNDNIYMTGRTTTISNYNDIFLLKYDTDGNFIWERLWGGIDGDSGFGVAVDYLDNIFVTGYQDHPDSPEIPILKYNSMGNLIWSKTWSGPKDENMKKIVTNGKELYLAGYTASYAIGIEDVLVLKYYLTPENFTLDSDAEIPDSNGEYNLTWSYSDYASNYSIYTDRNYFIEVNESSILIIP